jgi:hypothetical protein
MNRKKFLKLTLLTPLANLFQPMRLFADTSNDFIDNENVQYIKKGNALYDLLRQGFNKRINKYPSIIAQCFNEQGVMEAVQLAIKNKMPVSIKSGGHCMEGFSSNNGGLVINLQELNKIQWIDGNTIKVGPACKLSKLYDELLPKNKIIPGGSCAGVAIGGLSLGGGYGLLSRRFGLTCDSLQAVSMVDGRGRLLSSENDKDLLWACKGGNNGNFGVVSSLTFKVHQAPSTMQSFKFRSFKVSTERAKSIIEKWFKIAAELPDSCFSACILNHQTVYILITNTGEQTASFKQILQQFGSISDKATTGEKLPLSQALKIYYGRQYPLYFKNASAGLYKDFNSINSFIGEAIEIVRNTPGMIYQINTLGGKIKNEQFEKDSAFPHRDYFYFSELQTYWENATQGSKLLERFQKVQDVFIKNGIKAQYRNYPDVNFKNWPEYYYAGNYNKLKLIKQKHDPENLFRFEQSIV